MSDKPTKKDDAVDDRLLHAHAHPTNRERRAPSLSEQKKAPSFGKKEDSPDSERDIEKGEEEPRPTDATTDESDDFARGNFRSGMSDESSGTTCPIRTVARQGVVPGAQWIGSLDEEEGTADGTEEASSSGAAALMARVVDTEQELRLVRERDAYRDLVENAVVAQAVDSHEDLGAVKKRKLVALGTLVLVVVALIVALSVRFTRKRTPAVPVPAPPGNAPTGGPPTDDGAFQGNVCGLGPADAGRCQRACPSGQDSQCPGGETCFADVSCQDTPPTGENAPTDGDDDIIQGNTCGLDFEDASIKCQTRCPQGLDEECPGEEKCWASVSCRATRSNICGTNEQNAQEQCLTPCPQGKDMECPAFETCWASVSCLPPPWTRENFSYSKDNSTRIMIHEH